MAIIKLVKDNGHWDDSAYEYAQKIKDPGHPVFQAVEKMFDDWIEKSNPAMEYKEKYFGDFAIYSKQKAIEGAIDAALEYLYEEDLAFIDINSPKLDLIAQFEG